MATTAAPVAPITAGMATSRRPRDGGAGSGQSGLTQAIVALQTVVSAAQTVVADQGATRDQQQAARALVSILSAVLAKAAPAGGGSGSQPDRLYRMRPGDTLLGVAQTLLGDPLRWTEIRDKSGLSFLGADVGTVLRVPAV